jgi:phage FluMu protein Com
MPESTDVCAHCGAPRTPGFAACKFCNTLFPRAAQTAVQDNAVPCPQCKTLNEWGAQRCVKCQTWVVVQCVFCHALSPNHVPACLSCKETFAGAPERLAARQAQVDSQQRMQVVQSVGGVAASFLGAVAGAALTSNRHYGGYSSSGFAHRDHRDYEGDRSSSGGLLDAFTSSSSSSSSDGGSGGGLMDSLFSSSDSSSSSSSSSDGGSGGGLMDSLFSSSDSSSSSSDDGGSGGGLMDAFTSNSDD